MVWPHQLFSGQDIDYWLFGGWAVDFHAGRVTRAHEDVDVAVWHADLDRIRGLLEARGWVHAPDLGEDGYTQEHVGPRRRHRGFTQDPGQVAVAVPGGTVAEGAAGGFVHAGAELRPGREMGRGREPG
jgi:hypothetical protein